MIEGLIQQFLSSDHQLLDETIQQIHLLEKWFCLTLLLTGLGFILQKIIPLSARQFRWAILIACLANACLLRVTSPQRAFESMQIYDSVHYTVTAAQWLQTGHLTVPINGEDLSAAKPPGFSMVLAPFYLLFGENLGNAIWGPFFLGFFSLLLFYFFIQRVTDKTTACFGFLLLSFSPLHIAYSRTIMPSMAALFFVLAGALFLTQRERNPIHLWMAGLFLGFACLIRYFSAAAIFAALVFLPRLTPRKIFSFLFGCGLPLAGLLFYQWDVLGSPWVSNYDYWEHFFWTIQKPFSLDYALGIPPSSGGGPNILFNLFAATGAHIDYPNILVSRLDQIGYALLIWGCAIGGLTCLYKENRRWFFFIIIFFLGIYLPHAFLYSQASRFMLPVVPFILFCAARGMKALLEKCPPGLYSMGRLSLLAGLLSLIPFAYTFFHLPPLETPRQEFIDLIRKEVPAGSTLITDFDAILLTHLVGRPKQIYLFAPSRQVLYADRRRYLRGKILPPALAGATEHLKEIKKDLRQGEQFYLVQFDSTRDQKDYEKIFSTLNAQIAAKSKRYTLYVLSTQPN